MVELAEDFIDLLTCLNEANARYLLVGGYALNAHGVVRATEDLDVFIATDEANLQLVLRALRHFGVPPGLTVDALRPREPRPSGFRFGRRPVSVDLLSSIAGIEFEEVWSERATIRLASLEVPLISRRDLRTNKLAAGRLKDLADVEALDATEATL